MSLYIEGITKSEFKNILKENVREILNELPNSQQKKKAIEKDCFLNRKETAELLKISLATLSKLTSSGQLKSYKVGKRVLYKKLEVEESLTPVVTSKFKRNERI